MREWNKGDIITLPAKHVTLEMIRRYADAADDHNPLHLDPEFAKTTRYGGVIAHGMISMAFVLELLVRNFGKDWLESGTVEVSFMAPVRPGDFITEEAKVMKVTPVEGEEGKVRLRMQIVGMNAQQEKVSKGQAEVTVTR